LKDHDFYDAFLFYYIKLHWKKSSLKKYSIQKVSCEAIQKSIGVRVLKMLLDCKKWRNGTTEMSLR
jgi:hypothetical protein